MPKPQELIVSRLWSSPLGLGHKSEVMIEVRNASGIPISCRWTDEAPETFWRGLPHGALEVPASGAGAVSYPIEPHARGDKRFGDTWLRYQSPLKLAERWARATLKQTVRVYPNLEQAQKMRIYLIRSRQIELEKRLKRQRGLGREFESLREYRAGDEFRDISWSATARRGKLITKVHQIERSQAIWIVLDSGRLLRASVGDLTKIDYTVNAALALAQVAFGPGDRGGLLAYGRKASSCLVFVQRSSAFAGDDGEPRGGEPNLTKRIIYQWAEMLLGLQSWRSLGSLVVGDLAAKTCGNPGGNRLRGEDCAPPSVCFCELCQP